jgi:hypothetical protein
MVLLCGRAAVAHVFVWLHTSPSGEDDARSTLPLSGEAAKALITTCYYIHVDYYDYHCRVSKLANRLLLLSSTL